MACIKRGQPAIRHRVLPVYSPDKALRWAMTVRLPRDWEKPSAPTEMRGLDLKLFSSVKGISPDSIGFLFGLYRQRVLG